MVVQTKPDEPRPAPQHSPSRAKHAVTVLALIGLGLFVHRANFTYGLIGNDTYSQIITSRIESVGDLWGIFREPLAEDLIRASFYRPVQSLCMAFDYALWGLEPLGYQLTTLGVFAACIALLYLTTRKLLGNDAWLAPVVATLFFVLHPVLLNVLPAPCRRAEVLASAFLLAALLVMPVGSGGRTWRRCVLAGFFVLLACGSKEVGTIGVGLVFLHQLCFACEGSFARNARRAVLGALPAALAVTLYMLARTLVVGGLGGYRVADPSPFSELLRRSSAQLVVDILCPWSFIESWTPLQLGLVPLVILVLLTVAFALGGLLSGTREVRRVGLLVIGVAWILPLVLLLGLTQRYGPWYATVPLVGVALVVAGVVDGVRAMTGQRRPIRLLSVVPAAGVLIAMIIVLWSSPLFADYPHWATATQHLSDAQQRIDKKLRAARNGQRVDVRIARRVTPPVPNGRPYERSPSRPLLYAVSWFKMEALESWVRLRYPDKNVRVVRARSSASPLPRDGEILLVIDSEEPEAP
jgi:hypothetical protein